MTSLDVLTAGEALVLLAAELPGALEHVDRFRRFSAGAELNVAIGLSQLGLRVGYVSRVGNDAFGRFLRAQMEREGISLGLVATDRTRSGHGWCSSRATATGCRHGGNWTTSQAELASDRPVGVTAPAPPRSIRSNRSFRRQ